jgi:uncharacterized protein YcfJ
MEMEETKEMKTKILATVAIVGFMTTSAGAVAETVTDHYKSVIEQTPYRVEVCRDVSVSGDKTGDTLKGAIIGGIIGNNVGDIKNGGAAGALIGGILGHNNSKATGGTKRVCNIETRYEEQARQVYSHSIVTFTYNGKQQALRFTK